ERHAEAIALTIRRAVDAVRLGRLGVIAMIDGDFDEGRERRLELPSGARSLLVLGVVTILIIRDDAGVFRVAVRVIRDAAAKLHRQAVEALIVGSLGTIRQDLRAGSDRACIQCRAILERLRAREQRLDVLPARTVEPAETR